MLSGEQLADFNRGLIVLDLELSAEFCEGLQSELAPRYGSGHFAGTYADASGRRIQDAWRVSQKAHELARHPTVLAALEELYGRPPLPFQTLNFNYGNEQRAHADTIHFNSLPAGFVCGVLVALEDTHALSGPELYWPGTQAWSPVTMQTVGVAPTIENYPLYEQYIGGRLIAEPPPQALLLKRGQAAIWNGNLVHCGSRREDLALTRHSQLTHYFFAGCKYYTPLLSHAGQACWRQPAWIP